MPLILPRTPIPISPDAIALQGEVTLRFRLDSTSQALATIRYFLLEPSVVLVHGNNTLSAIVDGPMLVPVDIARRLTLANVQPLPPFHGLLRIHIEFQEVDAQGSSVGPARRRSARIIIT
jgi:hypothetical protein